MDILVVQLKTDELILARFRPKRGGVGFLSAERHAVTGDEEVARILAEAVAASGGDHRVALALPPSHLFMREVQLPISDRAKVRELLPLELKGETALDTDAVVFDALPLTDGRMLAIWGRLHELTSRIELLKGAGAEPETVTASLFHWNKLAPETGDVAVTDGEALAVYANGVTSFCRALPPGSGEDEVHRTLTALELSREVKVERVISHSNQSAEGETLAKASPSLAESFGGDAHAAHDLAGAYAVAAAVADGSAINLRRGPLAYTAGNEKLYRKLRMTVLLAAAVVLLFLVESGVRFYLVKRDLASLDKSISGIYREVFPSRKKAVDEVSEVRAEIKRLEGTRTSSNVLKLLQDLALAKNDDIGGIYETEITGTDVRLKGDAKSAEAVNAFKGRAAPLFASLDVGEVKSRPDGSVTFTLTGTLKGAQK
ncbi:type II secretion system protein GspL [Geomonas sp. Red32]|uniref:type II secretion system protein GspL n=1 Tax=Geomonas sp. Red32 TaxID=2912856 RepID=UPI00202D0D02|nr:type II secretion system protein GspL [Geomonas sp. Red32]MCM0080123.1 type II secretion system protein GspL [Geomonas sp. Red32]